MGNFVSLLFQRLLIEMISDSHCATDHKVHLQNLFLFVINNVFVFLVGEMAGLKTVGNIVKELAVLVLLGIEKESEVVKHIVK